MSRVRFFQLLTLLFLCSPAIGQDADRTMRGPHAAGLAGPTKLTADGSPIDVRSERGHSGPLVYDYDRDGVQDLLVGSFQGYVHFYKNTSTEGEPSYAHRGPIQAEGQPLKFHNW